MARNENPPFGRGETYFSGVGATTTDPSAGVVGKEWLFEDVNPNTRAVRSNKSVKCRAVRNVSAITLLPRRIAAFKNAADTHGIEVDGYTTTVAARGYLIDEYLPATGVVANDIFWVVVEGPAEGLTDIAAVDTINIGDKLVALTAVTSQATTAGRLDLAAYAVTEAALANQIMHYIGHALSAKTSANTNSTLLIDVGHW